MKNEPLQQSELLAKHFAPYRAEAPLISVPEIETLLAGSATADHPRNAFTFRRLFMTLSGLAGLAAISYFAFFNLSHGNNGSNRTHTTYASHGTQPQTAIATPADSEAATPQQKITKLLRKTDNPRGPWSAGNDQFYADLSQKELAKLGIVVHEDSILTYKLNDKDSVVWSQFSEFSVPGIKYKGHSIGGGGISASAPQGVDAHRFYPILMTYSNGNGAAYRIEEGDRSECGMIGPEDLNKQFRAWLEKPGTLGLQAMGFTTSSSRSQPCKDCPPIESDTIKIMVGKNLAPSPFPLIAPDIDSLSGKQKDALLQLAHYYEGTNSIKPSVTWPNNLPIKVDTFTARNLLDQMDSEENNGVEQHLRSIMARLNELVPVIVRPKGGSGAPDSNDYIFWYEPSEELFDALPPAQAAIIRTKLNEPPHCLTTPNAVLTSVDITYCVDKPQGVDFTVRDLTGKLWLSTGDFAHAGDNVFHLNTETLPSGMYIVTVRDQDSSERTRRIWVENAYPKSIDDYMDDELNDALKKGQNMRDASVHLNTSSIAGLPAIPMVDLSDEDLPQLGIENDEFLARFYQHNPLNASKIMAIGIERSGAVQIQNIDTEYAPIPVPDFRPQLVTDGVGAKRILIGDSLITLFGDKNNSIDNLIPVLLRYDTTSNSLSSRDLIFWYKPTAEFLALLPDSARTVAQTMANGTSNAAASVTDIHGAIQQAIAFPNPSKGSFSVQLTLGGARTLTFTLRNLLGQQAAPPVQARMDGTGEQSLDFSTAPEGVYLLDISTGQGERYIERVVIAH